MNDTDEILLENVGQDLQILNGNTLAFTGFNIFSYEATTKPKTKTLYLEFE